jgi:hypothetical protein
MFEHCCYYCFEHQRVSVKQGIKELLMKVYEI